MRPHELSWKLSHPAQHRRCDNVHMDKRKVCAWVRQYAPNPTPCPGWRILVHESGAYVVPVFRVRHDGCMDEIPSPSNQAERLLAIRARVRRSLDDPRPDLTGEELDARLEAALAREVVDANVGRVRSAEEVFDEMAARYARKAEERGE